MQSLKMFFFVIVISFVLAGCAGKGIPTGELPCSNVQTVVQKSNKGGPVRFNFCLDQVKPGSYVIQGNTNFETFGRITDTRLYLVLAKDREVVKRIPLQVRGKDMDKKLYFYKEFESDEPFDLVFFNWHFKYRF
ncbi:hypothetical protein [Pseudodesulfovibrio sediminis]|uniref:Lipoprotein n=1 Tax=Pseudodesulfovibrio sediminis TaxID=2810563 RepID=A0ABN6ESF6_9BACT|nr:hypothetical protein [Pseudodesulfovibrio sediminis]BCS88204.1 hypothetical protein PSDVSF_14460 [Pseudodesulfovibrio sediminis]